MLIAIGLIYSCTIVPNGGGFQTPTPNPGNPFEPYLELDYGKSNVDVFTCYNKAYPEQFNYDLSLIKLLYYYEENKYIVPEKNNYTIEIINGDGYY